jgi:predicted signal transduction protein with EAL and GGDEF domain
MTIDPEFGGKVMNMHTLFAEDSKSAALPIIAFLDQAGHSVTHVLNGTAAVAAYAIGLKPNNHTLGHEAGNETLRVAAHRLLAVLAQPMPLLNTPSRMGARIGIPLLPEHGRTKTDILTADAPAMYAAKCCRKGQIMLAERTP